MAACLIATCADWPDGNADLRALAQTLAAELKPWQAICPAEQRNTLILPLAVWDYSQSPDAYRRWLQALQQNGARLAHSAALQHWNMDKRYLIELAQQDLPVTPCRALLPGEDWAQTLAQLPWHAPVIKPLIGQSGRGVQRLQRLPALADYPDGLLVQAYVDAPFGEACLIYFNGEFSHAAHRKPRAGEWRANSAYGVEILPLTARPDWLTIGAKTLAALPETPLYARIDGLIDDSGQFHLNEVELIEPALYFSVAPHSLSRFAAAIDRRFPQKTT